VDRSDKISIKEYNYSLDNARIAKYPLEKRDESKLLIFNKGNISEAYFSEISDFLPEKSRLFCNNTRVIHARLKFEKPTGAAIEVFCLSPVNPVEYQLSFSQTESCIWNCMVGNLKKWKSEVLGLHIIIDGKELLLKAEKIETHHNSLIIRFSWNNKFSFGKILEEIGQIPIPPYLNRNSENIDTERYQTIYSKFDGSVAAPTAGLHFTPEVFKKLSTKEITLHEVTLHVGAGTFQPVKSENIRNHKMHKEYFSISLETVKLLAENEQPVVSIGTTTMRTLESIYWLAVKSLNEKKISAELYQWEHEELDDKIPVKTALKNLVKLLEKEKTDNFIASTSIMIVPGYRFRLVNGLITNFHQPQSTLLLLIAAFTGEKWKEIYNYALDHNFRFLSYGDSSLLLPDSYSNSIIL
jgi:S-adenosylmethionine:tRNA ribosyltransferase-isomerase